MGTENLSLESSITQILTKTNISAKWIFRTNETMNVHQILIQDKPLNSSELPRKLQTVIESNKAGFPDINYKLYDQISTREFINSNYKSSILETYDALKPYAYKADLARYCILAKIGGWYVDIGIKILQVLLPKDDIDLILFSDRGCTTSAPWAIQNGLIYAKPENEVFYYAIELIYENYKNRFYGKTALDPTGPNLFGRAVAFHVHKYNAYYGQFRQLTSDLSINNLMYVSQDGQLIAQHKTSWAPGAEGGDLRFLGLTGTNNYKELWSKKDIYEK
jgi:mannosyltransferase OCH1-like enzyme